MPPKTRPKTKPKHKKPHKPPERSRPIKRKVNVKTIHIPISSIHRDSCERTYLGYKEGKQLGGGLFGTVHELCDAKNECPYVLKVIPFTFAPHEPSLERKYELFAEEVKFQKMAHAFAPKIHDAWTCLTHFHNIVGQPWGYGFIVMDRMDGTLGQYLQSHSVDQTFVNNLIETLQSHIQKLHKMGIEHNDITYHNIFFKGDKWYLGDFGNARLFENNQEDAWALERLMQQFNKEKPTYRLPRVFKYISPNL